MNEIILTFLSLSVSGGLAALALFALNRLFRNRLRKSWQYYIWLVVLLRMILPFAPGVSLIGLFSHADFSALNGSVISDASDVESAEAYSASVGNLSTAAPVMSEISFTPISESNSDTAFTEPESPVNDLAKTPSIDLMALTRAMIPYVWLIWPIVAAALLSAQIVRYLRYTAFIKAGSRSVGDAALNEIYAGIRREVGVSKDIPLCVNPVVNTPMLVGIIKPFIVLPAVIPNSEAGMMLRHELTHYKRRDILYKWFTQVIVCVHWFNPVVYLIRKEVNKNCELACDEAVLGLLGEEGKRGYGDALMSLISKPKKYSAVVSMNMSEDGRNLKERLESIMTYSGKSIIKRLLSVALAATLIVGALFLGSYTSTKAEAAEPAAATNSTPAAAESPAAQATAAPTASAASAPAATAALTPDERLEKCYADRDLVNFVRAIPGASADEVQSMLVKTINDKAYPYFTCLYSRISELQPDAVASLKEKYEALDNRPMLIKDIFSKNTTKYSYGDIKINSDGTISLICEKGGVIKWYIGDISTLDPDAFAVWLKAQGSTYSGIFSNSNSSGSANTDVWQNNTNELPELSQTSHANSYQIAKIIQAYLDWGGIAAPAWINALVTSTASAYTDTPVIHSLDDCKALVYDQPKITTREFDTAAALDVSTISDSITFVRGDKFTVSYSEWFTGEYSLTEDNGKITLTENLYPYCTDGDYQCSGVWLPDYLQSRGQKLNKTVTITVPAGMSLGDINIDAVYGVVSVNVPNFNCGSFTALFSDGSVNLTDCGIGTIKIATLSGETTINNCDFDSLSVATTSGDCSLTLANPAERPSVEFYSTRGMLHITN